MMNWITPEFMQRLAGSLLHFLWQGVAIALLAMIALRLLSRRSAELRYTVSVVALLSMFAAPLLTFVFYAETGAAALRLMKLTGDTLARSAFMTLPSASASAWIQWIVIAWFSGVIACSVRLAAGWGLSRELIRSSDPLVAGAAVQVFENIRESLVGSRVVRLLLSTRIDTPAVIGWLQPAILLPLSAITGLKDDQLRAVLAHELAHIRRHDFLINAMQRCVESVLFYHPAVWWLNKRIRAEREHCCDEIAVSVCGNALEYARALTLMEEWRRAPVFALAANGGPLTDRIIRVLGIKTLGAGVRSVGLTGGLLCLSAALLSGNALLDLARPASARANSRAQTASSDSSREPASRTKVASKPFASRSTDPEQTQSTTRTTTTTATSTNTATSYIEGMKSLGLTGLSIDTLIALKVQDVTPDYVRGLQEQGVHPDAEKLIAMRVQGISPEYVRNLRAAGLNPSVDQLIALKVQDADGEYYRGLKEAGIDPDIDRLIALRVQGVTPEYVRGLRAAGLTLTADQVIAMKVQGVTPEYLKKMHEQGIDLGSNDVISMRVQDVTPEYVHDIKALGLKPSSKELISMKVQDVTPEYVKALQSAGFNPSISDIISAKVQDVTPEFIARAKEHGFKDLSLQKLIQLRQLGILDSKADI